MSCIKFGVCAHSVFSIIIIVIIVISIYVIIYFFRSLSNTENVVAFFTKITYNKFKPSNILIVSDKCGKDNYQSHHEQYQEKNLMTLHKSLLQYLNPFGPYCIELFRYDSPQQLHLRYHTTYQ